VFVLDRGTIDKTAKTATITRLAATCIVVALHILTPEVGAAVRAETEFVYADGNPSSTPEWLTANDDHLFFAADDGYHGKEIWCVDRAGQARLVVDAIPGSEGSNPRRLVLCGKVLCAIVDGLIPGNQRQTGILYVRARPHGSGPYWAYLNADIADESGLMGAAGDTVFIANRDPQHGVELWQLDPRDTTLSLVKDVLPGASGGLAPDTREARALGNRLLFKALCPDPSCLDNYRLWVSDGTAQGTFPLLPGEVGEYAEPRYLEAFGTRAFFRGGGTLWVTDGTPKGTREIRVVQTPSNFHAFNDIILFQGEDGQHGLELWRTDGTNEGTWMVKDIQPGPQGSGPFHFGSLPDGLLFCANDGIHGYELWRTDGTEGGTVLVADIYPGPSSSDLYQPTVFENVFYFAADHPDYGEELWRSDGTSEGTRLVKEIRPGKESAEPYYLTIFNQRLYFSANDGIHGEELWLTDGTEAGTVLAADIAPAVRRIRSSNPSHLTPLACGEEHKLFFVVDDVMHGAELWVTDFQAGATFMVRDIHPGPGHSDPAELVTAGETLFFTANDGEHGRELWRSQETTASVVMVTDLLAGSAGSEPRHLTPSENTLFFVADTAAGGETLFQVAPPYDAPQVLAAIADWVPDSKVQRIKSLEDHLCLCLETAAGVYHFIEWDATRGKAAKLPFDIQAPGTWEAFQALAEANPSQDRALMHAYLATTAMQGRGALRFRDTLFFRAYTREHGDELWCGDGTVSRASLFLDCLPGPASGGPDELTGLDTKFYFTAEHGTYGREVWESDGTFAGTRCTHEWNPGRMGADPRFLTVTKNTLFLSMCRTASHRGRPEVAWLAPHGEFVALKRPLGYVDPLEPRDFVVIGDHVAFSAVGYGSGRELWITGVSKGTRLLANILPDTGCDDWNQACPVRP